MPLVMGMRNHKPAAFYRDAVGVKFGESIHDGYAVRFNGYICSPRFNSEGAARAYLDALQKGTRSPEFEEVG